MVESDLMEQICKAIRRSPLDLEALAHRAQVSPRTIYFWLTGATKSARIGTLEKVAAAMGFRVAMIEDRFVLAPIERAPVPQSVKRAPRIALWLRQ